MTAVVALILAALAVPSLLFRAVGGRAPSPGPKLAALAPIAVLPAIAAVAVAAFADWRLAVALAVPAAFLVSWQLPTGRGAGRDRGLAAGGPLPGGCTLRVLTINAEFGSARPWAIARVVRQSQADVLAVQELTPRLAARLARAGVTRLLPYSHLDPRPGFPGTGLWARWPLTPLPPVPGLVSAAPRALMSPPGGPPVTLAAVHPIAPLKGRSRDWQRDLTLLRSALAAASGPQIVAGDFNASRDHKPFRDLLAAGLADCADEAARRPWPGFTWPSLARLPSLMRLDHILVTRAGTRFTEARVLRVPGTDHRAVLAVIDVGPPG